MKNKYLTFLGLAIAGIITITTSKLTAASLGDAAPPLKISTWIKGDAVDMEKGKGKNVYVVEFWATWCPPCRESIPHLTELQKKFKDKGVVFVGISTEKERVVRPFVEKMGEKMDYVVALDDGDKTSDGYMKAFGIDGIPHAFVVDKAGKIVWNGHPMDDLEKVLQEVVEGKFDISKAVKRDAGRKQLEELIELISKGEDDKAAELAKKLEALDKEVGGIRPDGKKFVADEIRKLVKFEMLVQQYADGLMEGKANAAELEKLEKQLADVAPPDFKVQEFKADIQLQNYFGQYYQAVTRNTDDEKAAGLAEKLKATGSKNVELLNEIAWALLTDERIKKRDLNLALALAKTAFDASKGEDANVADTYARALFDSGKVEAAIEHQKKAVNLAREKEKKAEFEKTLKKYQDARQKKE